MCAVSIAPKLILNVGHIFGSWVSIVLLNDEISACPLPESKIGDKNSHPDENDEEKFILNHSPYGRTLIMVHLADLTEFEVLC